MDKIKAPTIIGAIKQQPTSNPSPQQQQQQQQPQSNPFRLLADKLIFLDVNSSYKNLKILKFCLNEIGSKLADCLSKEVNYVITNRDKTVLNDSTNPSPTVDAIRSDSNKKIKTSPNGLSFSSRTSVVNRIQTIMEKSSKGYKSDILTTAQRLGIDVIHVNELDRHVDRFYQKLKLLTQNKDIEAIEAIKDTQSKTKVTQLTKKDLDFSNHKIYKLKIPYLKFEPICKQYKPIYQEFKEWHEIYYELTAASRGTSSPFQVYFSDDIKQNDGECLSSSENNASFDENQSTANNTNKSKPNTQLNDSQFKSPQSSNQQQQQPQFSTNVNSSQPRKMNHSISNNNLNSNGNTTKDAKTNSNFPPVKIKSTGFCECCKQRFDNLRQHLTSAQHENFDRNISNFKEIDEYVNGVLNFQRFIESKNFAKKNNDVETLDEVKMNVQQQNVDVANNPTSRLSMTTTLMTTPANASIKNNQSMNNTTLNDTTLNNMNTDTSFCNQQVLLEVFGDLTYEPVDQQKK